MRYAALSLPYWPVERARRAGPPDNNRPFALIAPGAGGERLYAVCPAAARAGLAMSMRVADARALVPDLHVSPADPDGDRAALNDLARWCGRVSPWTAPDPGAAAHLSGVLMDITGCARVFVGEDRLLDGLIGDVRALGFTARAAAAPTLGLAWALARHGEPGRRGWCAAEDAHGALAPLPVEALRLTPETCAALRRFGLNTAGALMALPRRALVRRFGPELARRLDQALGGVRETLSPLRPAPALRARVRFAEPLITLESVGEAFAHALTRLCALLEREGLGARRVRLTLYRADGGVGEMMLAAAAPVRDSAHLIRLMRHRLERAGLDAGFGVDLVEVAALLTRPLDVGQTSLDPDAGAERLAAARLMDRLDARLGAGAAACAEAVDSHAPERAGRWRAGAAAPAVWPRRPERRPLLILDPPEPAEAVAEIPDGPPRRFTWRRVAHTVARAEGPERIAPEWWRLTPGAAARTRDYFRVETGEGRRFWLYREGLYGRETQQPGWFVHGAG
jgi:protein ImuB